jgi:hypothetical protein
MQAQMKLLTVIEKMKRSQETCSPTTGHCHLEKSYGGDTETPAEVQDEAYTIFEEIEGQGSQLEQVVMKWNNAWKGLSPRK